VAIPQFVLHREGIAQDGHATMPEFRESALEDNSGKPAH
jgi:hypothetical protein